MSDSVALHRVLLGSKNCQLNAKDFWGTLPLHLAAQNENLTLVKNLIEHGAEVDCRDDSMLTPLLCAVTNNEKTEIVEFLLENDADVHAKDSEGKSSLFHATSVLTWKRQENMLKVLLNYGVQVNMLNIIYNDNKVKLQFMARNMIMNCVKTLPEYGLDISDSQFCEYLYTHSYGADRVLEQHRIKLKTAGIYCSADYMTRRGDDDYKKCYEECLKEIGILKTIFIDSRTSLYDFLRKNLDSKRVYINNEKLKKLVDSKALEKEFPHYSVLTLAGYRQAVARKSLLNSAKKAWLELTEIRVPDVCIELVLSYLNDAVLVKMIGGL